MEVMESLLVADHLTDLYLSRLAPRSQRATRYALDVVADTLTAGRCTAANMTWSEVRHQHTAKVGAKLAERYAPATVNKMLSALRGVLKEAVRAGDLAAHHYLEMSFGPYFPGSTRSTSRPMTTGELRALFCVCASDPRPAGARDTAMLGVLYGAGLRRGEVVALELSDFSSRRRELRVRGWKGTRICYLQAICARLLDRWVELRGAEPGALFCAINRGNRIALRPMSDQSVYDIVHRRARQCGVSAFPVHSLRRTFIGNVLNNGADIATAQKLAGHLRLSSTTRYDSRDAAPIDIALDVAALLDKRYRAATAKSRPRVR